jgi:hypothetical protein
MVLTRRRGEEDLQALHDPIGMMIQADFEQDHYVAVSSVPRKGWRLK